MRRVISILLLSAGLAGYSMLGPARSGAQEDGDLVASGMYLYLPTDNQGGQTRGKLTIIK
jgi:hypothetical protein